MKHNENDITKQIEVAQNGDKKHAIGNRQYLECCERVIVHQFGYEVKYQQKQRYHENKSHDLGINGKNVSLYLIRSNKTQGEITNLSTKARVCLALKAGYNGLIHGYHDRCVYALS